MCFHTSQTRRIVQLEKRYDATLTKPDAREVYDIPRYHLNGFSHPDMLIIPQEEPSVLAPALWGIVPSNKKPEHIRHYYKEAIKYGGGLNAQSEKLFDHFIYKHSALIRRCIIPVTGFFEPHDFKGQKYPFHIKRKDNNVLSLAGVYTILGNVVTFTILTKKASPLFAKIHNKKNRQPVILKCDFEQDWLKDDLHAGGIQELINLEYDEDELSAYTVTRDLFKPSINTNVETIIDEVKYEELVF